MIPMRLRVDVRSPIPIRWQLSEQLNRRPARRLLLPAQPGRPARPRGLGEGRRVALRPGSRRCALPVSLSDTVRALRERRSRRGATVAVGAMHRGRRRVRLHAPRPSPGQPSRVRCRGRLLDRARHRGHRQPVGPRRARSRRRPCYTARPLRETPVTRRPLFGRRLARASPRPVPPHARRPRARRPRRDRLARRASGDAGRVSGASPTVDVLRLGETLAQACRSSTWAAEPSDDPWFFAVRLRRRAGRLAARYAR